MEDLKKTMPRHLRCWKWQETHWGRYVTNEPSEWFWRILRGLQSLVDVEVSALNLCKSQWECFPRSFRPLIDHHGLWSPFTLVPLRSVGSKVMIGYPGSESRDYSRHGVRRNQGEAQPLFFILFFPCIRELDSHALTQTPMSLAQLVTDMDVREWECEF